MPFDLPYADLMERHGFIPANHARPEFFPVAARKLYDETGAELPGWKRIVREDENKTLHVASDAYQIVSNEEAFGAFEAALAESTLDLEGMQIGTDYAAGGARCFRQYLLPAHQVQIRPGNIVALRVIMMNSYDGSTKFRGNAGAYSCVCANTSLLGTDYGKFSFAHRADQVIDVAGAARGLVQAAADHLAVTARWKAWPDIPVSDEQAIAVFGEIPFATKTLVDHLVHAWVRARNGDGPQTGANLWALFNVLTAWATHGETDSKIGRAQVKLERETKVAKLVEGKLWKGLAEGDHGLVAEATAAAPRARARRALAAA